MTSAKLFSKFCKENWRQKGWLWILSGLIFTVFTFTFFMQDVLMDSDEMYFGLYNTKMMWITRRGGYDRISGIWIFAAGKDG